MKLFPEVQIFTISCETGCSCCREENHTRGPFSSRTVAEARVVEYRKLGFIGSQYARHGIFYIYEYTGEQLPDGRIICDSFVYSGMKDTTTPGSNDEKCDNN